MPDALTSTASRPAFVTTRDRPSCRNETAMDMHLIWVRPERKYFCKWGWTAELPNTTDLPVGQICGWVPSRRTMSAVRAKDVVIGRPSLWIAEDFGVLRFRLMVKR